MSSPPTLLRPTAAESVRSVAAPTFRPLQTDSFYARRLRRVLDLILLGLALPLALPVGFIVALCNACSLGSLRRVFFLQERVGQHGKIFRIVKFRTMRPTNSSDMESWSSGTDQQRVTALGRFLRNAHLDELPQLWNVLVGDMGFMGPRPEMLEIEAWASEHILGFSTRLRIRPGISGLAQITQGYTPRDLEAYRRKLELNLAYLERLSLWTDVQVFFGTVAWVLRRKGWKWEARDSAVRGTEPNRSMKTSAPLPQEP